MAIIHMVQPNRTSGMTGVHWNARKGVWRATIGFGKAKKQLYEGVNLDTARARRLQAESFYGIGGGKIDYEKVENQKINPEDSRAVKDAKFAKQFGQKMNAGYYGGKSDRAKIARKSGADRWAELTLTEKKRFRKMRDKAPAWVKPFLAAERKAAKKKWQVSS